MQKSLLTIFGLSATFFLIGCADDKARQQIADTNVKLAQVEQNVGLLGTKVSNQQLVDILNKLDGLQNQINELNGSVDTLKHEQKSYQSTQDQVNQSVQQQVGAAVAPAAAATAEHKAATAETKATETTEDETNEELKSALRHIKAHNFRAATKELKAVIKTSNNPAVVANATYYLAISYAASGQYKNSITAAKGFIELSPDNHNVPDAMRTIYISQKQLGMIKSAKSTADTLIEKYPDSNAAKKVAEDLNKKKSGT